jgi:hypothetical protein
MNYLRPLLVALLFLLTASTLSGCAMFASSTELARINAKYDDLVQACIGQQEREYPAQSATYNRNYCADRFAMARATELNYETIGPLGRWTQDNTGGGSGFSYTFIAK